MLNLVKNLLEVTPTITSVWLEELCFLSSCRFIYEVFDCITNCFAQGNRRSYVMETVKADDKAKLGKRRSILFFFIQSAVQIPTLTIFIPHLAHTFHWITHDQIWYWMMTIMVCASPCEAAFKMSTVY